MQNSLHASLSKTLLPAAALLTAVLTCSTAPAQEEFEGWHLEPSIGQAHLVMVARVARISRVTLVEGAKTDVALREYRFQPVRVLKGIFQRDELSMTASDLGISADGDPPLAEGGFRLLILIQPRGLQSYGCVAAAPGAATFAERVPLVTGSEDPLVGVADTLIRVADSRSRRERASLLVQRLIETHGLAAVPLLSSLRLRADWAAADRRAYESLAELAVDSHTAIRGGAVELLREMLASGATPDEPRQLQGVTEALREILESDEANTRIRVAALKAFGHLGRLRPFSADADWLRVLLTRHMIDGATYAERLAAVAALGHPSAAASTPVLDALAALPLDESPERERVYIRAAVRRHAATGWAAPILLERLKRSIAARQSLEAEIEPLGRMRSEESLPLLLEAAGQLGLSRDDRLQIASALGQLGDDRAVRVLADWLRTDDYRVKAAALAALETIDSPLAAREVRPLIKTEPNLTYKLRIARLLARHGLGDGYALATEHLADDEHLAAATLVLVVLDDPRTSGDLATILTTRPDQRWRAAALTGLAATGDAAARQQLLEILSDDRHPLAAAAAEAAGLSADAALLPPLAELVDSRNRRIALASLVALRRFLSGVRTSPRGLAAADLIADELNNSEPPAPAAEVPPETRAALAEAVASLAADAYVDAQLRHEALAVARLLGGQRYTELLTDLADQAELEGAELLAKVQMEMRRTNCLVRQ